MASQKYYDVFLSYHGQGSRNNFVDDIVYGLGTKGISTGMGDMCRGPEGLVMIPHSKHKDRIYRSVEHASMTLIVFDKIYVTTPSCLDKLVKIMEFSKAIEGSHANVLPLYCGVDPLEIRNSDWPYMKIDGEYSDERLELWKRSVMDLTTLPGLKMKNIPRGYCDFIKEIAATVLKNLGRMPISNVDRNVVELVRPYNRHARPVTVKSEVYSSKSPSYSKGQRFGWTYDVFVSFRGDDTRKNFVDHLFAALKGHGINTFNDNEKLDRGKSIAPKLLEAIEESAIAIVIFSKNYASSTWCLDELVKIMSCHKTKGRSVYPVFYDVDPSDVRKQQGHFGEGFGQHQKTDKIRIWREVLVEAANFSGWDLKTVANG
ncbi:TMV resistance protein N [Tanacetum coccineum]